MPDEHQRADAGGEQAREEHEGQRRAAEPGGLDDDHGADDRRPEDGGESRKAAGGRDDELRLVRHVALRELHDPERQPGAESDQRRLRPQHEAERDGGQGCQHDARELHGRRRRTGLEALGGPVAAVTGQPGDRERHHHPGHEQHGDRPPPGELVVAQRVREVVVHPLLEPVDQLEEDPAGERDDHPDHRRHHQQPAVGLGADHGGGVGSRRRGRGRLPRGHRPVGVTHGLIMAGAAHQPQRCPGFGGSHCRSPAWRARRVRLRRAQLGLSRAVVRRTVVHRTRSPPGPASRLWITAGGAFGSPRIEP